FPSLANVVQPGVERVATDVVVAVCALTTTVSGLQYLLIGIRKLSDA
ncbi:MAG: hypothetical protein HZA60_00210, partial [Deltaproteobacteria bacterium]|nr:hypothetical protein [Deltaproteobacteria bacterium]